MLLLLASVNILNKQGKDGLTRLVQEYDAGKAKCTLPKEANLIKQKYFESTRQQSASWWHILRSVQGF